MNIVLATDDNFVQHCGTTIKSITTNNSHVKFYLLTEGLKPENAAILKNLANDNGCSLEFCVVPSDIVKYFPMSKMASNHISIATYYRLFVTSLLPDEVDKVIYLDCDMIIRGSLEGLWETDLRNAPLAAVYQHNDWADHNNSWERLDIPREYGYFNAGCLVLNIEYLRSCDFQQKAIDYINSHFDHIISHDQDVLNAMFYKQAVALSCRWNYLPLFIEKMFKSAEFPLKCDYHREKEDESFDPIVIHFVSKPKPWDFGCDNPYTEEYYKYLSKTPWKDYKPNFVAKDYYQYKVIPSIKRLLKSLDIFHLSDYVYRKRTLRRK